MIYARDALADLFALTRFLIPVAFTDIAIDVAEQVTRFESVASIYSSVSQGSAYLSATQRKVNKIAIPFTLYSF